MNKAKWIISAVLVFLVLGLLSTVEPSTPPEAEEEYSGINITNPPPSNIAKPSLPREEKPEIEESTGWSDEDFAELEYSMLFSEYQQTIVNATGDISYLLETYNPMSSDWVTNMALALYLIDSSADEIRNMTGIPAYFRDGHERYLREGIAPLKDFVSELTRAIDNNDPALLQQAVSSLEKYTDSFLDYAGFVTARVQQMN